jgi:hypothetical protein
MGMGMGMGMGMDARAGTRPLHPARGKFSSRR